MLRDSLDKVISACYDSGTRETRAATDEICGAPRWNRHGTAPFVWAVFFETAFLFFSVLPASRIRLSSLGSHSSAALFP